MQDWNDLRYFVAIARAGSLAGAARALQVNHTTVFRRLNSLESAAGVRLFDRLPQGYALTEAGEDMLGSATQVADLMDDLDRRLAGRDYRLSGTIRLTTTDTLAAHYLHPHLQRFQARFPGIVLELVTGNVFFDLSRREADIALRPTDDPPPHLVGRDLARVGWAVYGANRYLAERATPRRLADLAGHSIIHGDDSLAGVKAMRWVRARVPQSAIVYRASSFAAQLAAAQAGLGLAVLPCVLAEPARGVQCVLGPIDALATGLWLLTHADLRTSARIRAFMSFMTDAVHADRAALAGQTSGEAHPDASA